MKQLLTEANLTNFSELLTAINKVLDNKDIPQFAGSETNKVRDWFLKQYVKAIKEDEVDPEDVVDEISHTVDYFATLDANDLRKIYKEPYRVIKQKVQEWDRELASTSSDTKKEDTLKKTLTKGTDYKIIKEISGLKWVKLLTPKAKDVEGDVMGHCVGGEGYENKDIYSLWDNRDRSHVTIEADDNRKTIQQIKGKQNREPVEKYQPACVEFIANAMLQGFKVQGDGENIGMIKHNSEYHFDDLNVLPEKFRNKEIFRTWVDKIFPTEIFPKQQKAIADIAKRIVEV